jgi:hypothetical protein
MSAIETRRPDGTESLEIVQPVEIDQSSKVSRILQSASSLAIRAFGFFPNEAPDYMSEHFGHASKRNDLNPKFEDTRG